MHGARPDRRSSASSVSATRLRRRRAHYQEICPSCRRALVRSRAGRAVGTERAAASERARMRQDDQPWQTIPVDELQHHRALRTAPVVDDGRRGWRPSVEPDRLVKTHCCFCGQQCGIQLKVNDNEVIGFEPWEDFPFNRGMLCPKGVKRYLQGSHPDRLLTALRRDPTARGRLPPDAVRRRRSPRPRPRDRAAAEHARPRCLRRARRREPDDREDVPAGQVRAGVPQDAVHRLQRPALHGQRRGGEQEGVRHRSRGQPVVGHPRRRGRSGSAGSNVAECAPITTNYVWQAREHGAEGHRPGPADHADRAHLRPVSAGQARAATRRCSPACCS